MKIVLPKGLISIERDDGQHSLTHFDVCQIDPDEGVRIPLDIGTEFDHFLAWMEPNKRFRSFNRVEMLYKEHGICISSALDVPETPDVAQTLYGMVKPWGAIRVEDYRAVEGSLATPFPKDASDQVLLNRLEHLVLNTLLFLSAAPLEYESETILRKAKTEGKRTIPGLFAARFVGQVQLRPIPKGRAVQATTSAVTGRHLSAHWRSGHWKRQVYGEGRSQRKLIWIMPYEAGEKPEEEE